MEIDIATELGVDSMAVVESVDAPSEASLRQDRPDEDRPEQVAASVVVPDLKPAVDASADDVQPTSGIEEPAMQSAAEPGLPAEPVAAEAPAGEPAVPPAASEPNLFEEADLVDEAEQAAVPDAASADAVADPAADASPATEEGGPPPEPLVSPDAIDREPVQESPAEPPANPLDEAERRSGEAARLWVDATGRHSAVGVLVEVSVDGRCVIDTGAGILEVRSSDLRRRDRDYATQAAERLATRRGPGPAETAGR